MPCYHDIPDETDQIKIENRCKARMYFNAIELITNEQILKSQEHISPFPLPDVNSALCKLCRILNKEQMEKIDAYYFQIKWGHKTLYDWYVQHCKDDKYYNVEK